MDSPQIDVYEFLTEAELQHYYNAVKDELKITNASQFKYATDEDLKSIGMSRPEIRRLRKFYEKHFPHGYLSKIKRLLQAPTVIGGKRDENSGCTVNATMASPSGSLSGASTGGASSKASSGSPNKAPNNKHIIPADAISVNKQLGTGEFGIVQQGVWTNGSERIQVAIKCLCRERMQSNPMEFLKEAAIMHSIEHENIVRLYGVVLATDSLMLVTELAHLRSLLECLKDPGLRVSFLTVPTLCEFGLQICNGMRYLENKRLIHRDLAARNILVFSKNKVKISDFGLSRALGVGKDYYKTNFNVNLKLPIAWCAPECINYLRFTNASDVWAFGVCLWEMFSYGFQPWAALTGLQILEAIDAPNYQRLEQPECCPREYYTLMMKCWQDDPSKRPKFSEIYELLPDMKPEQLKAVANCMEAKTNEHLIYRQNEIITVLDRNTGTPYWKGVLNSGKTGFFNPSNTVAYVEGLPTLNRDTFTRNANERSSKRKLRTEMISKPQNDFKHTGHVGIDGASFGDIAFLGTTQNYNHVPRQIVTPYKPSEDIEQTPLLLPPTPTSPDSLQTASGYFADDSSHHNSTMNPSFIPSTENTPKQFANNGQTTTFEFPSNNTNPFTHKSMDESTTSSASTLALQNNNYGIEAAKENLLWRHSSITNGAGGGSGVQFEEPHEYHEISDDEITPDKLDFGPSLLDEINSMFGSMSATASSSKNSESESHGNKRSDFSDLTSKLIRKNSGGHNTKKSKNSSGTVKPISVKDEKILNQAIEIANEISARSMCDLVSDQTPSTQSPKRKFSFRFPHLSGGHGSSGSGDKSHGSSLHSSGTSGSTTNMNSLSPHSKKKNFTEELKSIPDLQAIIGEDGREAYNSLIERKHIMGIEPNTTSSSTCILRKPDSAQFPLKSAKTLPRRSCNLNKDVDFGVGGSTHHIERSSSHNEHELVIPPIQNAPRPTTLPTRGARGRKAADLGLFRDPAAETPNMDTNTHQAVNNRLSDNISPCESPSYVTNTSSYKFPEQSSTTDKTPDGTDLNPLPVPPKEGKKHIQTNAKRHVRKYPLIIPANGVQRTLNKVMGEEQSVLRGLTTSNGSQLSSNMARNMATVPTIKPFNINNNNCSSTLAEYENTTKLSSSSSSSSAQQERTYQNIGTDDTASLQFESILEADFNKDQVLQSPDVTDGFYNFSIQKDHYHKSKEMEFDAQKLADGLYVNEDELRNLDIDKNLVKISKQNMENKKSNESLEVKQLTTTPSPPPPVPTTAPPEEATSLEVPKSHELTAKDNNSSSTSFSSHTTERSMTPTTQVTNTASSLSSQHATTQMSERNLKAPKTSMSPPSAKSDNELAGNALFQRVRESVDKAMVNKPTDAASTLIKPLTEAELFSAAVNRLNDSNSVSCEDLLEFSDKKPKGHERGVDSDEVRIMMKVLGKDSSPERCLKSLEFIEWDVHKAIKIIKLQNILKDIQLTMSETVEYLLKYDWDLHTTARRLKSLKT
ncbi:activated Cdc42 kinase-like [Musca domestica]|uniref:non-specific protein-tyrosine kinase n=2 Tax=Musca domestica TaxID=7370 RepID=A0A1I8MRF3_MUSDO|nr:activated Cdc42 kinase-like [Musca domestica]